VRRSESRRLVKEAKASARAYVPSSKPLPEPHYVHVLHDISMMQLANEGIITRREAMERMPLI